ncbi:Sucrase/ferredoxin-like-domain-containing protein [Xylariales sp. PMI_506]|nr:Sucrase/ferredoxin-like-domain-containing protein [Xylariales sp. PMI_506]
MSDVKSKQGQQLPAEGQQDKKPPKDLYPMSNWKYDVFGWFMSVLIDLFFREVSHRGSWYVPRKGPVLFIAAPHHNQFVDGIVLQRTLRNEAQRRVSLLIAQKSVHGFVGWGSRQTGSVPVGRAQDSAKPAKGMIYMPDPINDPYLIRGVGTNFEKDAEVGGMIFLPSVKGMSGSSVDIAQILGPEEIRTKRPFKGTVPLRQLTGRDDIDESGNFTSKTVKGPKDGYPGTKFKLAPHIDQTLVYQAVFDRLKSGGCVGIFPEGGSHDRTELLPLKAGVAIMALGTLAQDPDCGLTIVPVGMNYFHAHKFRSRAVVEFGAPFEVPRDLLHKYQNNERREAIGTLLDMCTVALTSVTVSAPDYDTLMSIQTARRLYTTGKKLPLTHVVELNRKLSKGFSKFKDDPRIISVLDNTKEYNKQLRYLNIKDHQLESAKRSLPTVIFLLLVRVVKLSVLSIGVIPGLILFAPVFIVAKVISVQKAKTALAGSSVKIAGRDVMATWKLLVAMGFAPILYNFYCVLLAYTRAWGYAPDWLPWYAIFPLGWIIFPAITFAALRFGEIGMDIVKSLRPLVLCLSPTSNYNIQKLREKRAILANQVVEVINELGPDMYDDFERSRMVKDPAFPGGATSIPDLAGFGSEPGSPDSYDHPSLLRKNTTASSRAIPRNESFSNIGSIGLFATRPPSRSRSRSSSSGGGFGSAGFPVSGFTTLDSKEGFDEASSKIRQAMMERGQMRRRKSGGQLSEPDSEEEASQPELPSESVHIYLRETAPHRAPPSPSFSMSAVSPPPSHNPRSLPPPPIKQKMALGFRSLVDTARRFASLPGTPQNEKTPFASLFSVTTPEVDGDDCSHDCESCHVSYPRGFKIDESDVLYGHVKGWSTHVLVATGKSDWVRDVEDEKGSVMQAFGRADKPSNGRMMLSASNIPTPNHTSDYSEPTTVLLLPAFRIVEGVTPPSVPALVEWIDQAPTSTMPIDAPVTLPRTVSLPGPDLQQLTTRPSPHAALILLCSQKTRDARCGQSAPLLRKELERHLRPLGLFRDLDDERPGGVGIYFISHVGGHKYSANVMVYRRPDAFGVDAVERAKLPAGEELKPVKKEKEGEDEQDPGAAQCIWLARVMPEDCENLVRYTVLQGKVVKPETQLRGGFDRAKGLLSW